MGVFTTFLPYLGVFIYLIARGGSMWERNARDKAAWQQMTRGSDPGVAVRPSTVEEPAKLAVLLDRGVLATGEFDQQKALLLGEPAHIPNPAYERAFSARVLMPELRRLRALSRQQPRPLPRLPLRHQRPAVGEGPRGVERSTHARTVTIDD